MIVVVIVLVVVVAVGRGVVLVATVVVHVATVVVVVVVECSDGSCRIFVVYNLHCHQSYGPAGGYQGVAGGTDVFDFVDDVDKAVNNLNVLIVEEGSALLVE